MGRRLSWLDRLYPISRTVAGSARSHYDRKDLQQLFEIQPRSAQNLMAALPTVAVGRARLVERETLSNFLQQLQQADDPAQAYGDIREGKGKTTVRRKLRSLVLQDVDSGVDSLPGSIHLSPGRLNITFQTVDELAEALMHLAVVLDKQLDEFITRYEPPPEPSPEELAEREADRADAEYFRNWGR
jgi:hypothetical protein